MKKKSATKKLAAVRSHLKGDIKTFGKEAEEDRELIKKLGKKKAKKAKS